MKKEQDQSRNNAKKDSEYAETFCAALLFTFSAVFYPPVEIYLSNIKDILAPSKYVLIPFLVISAAVLIVLTAVLAKLPEKAGNAVKCVLIALSLDIYIQGSFLQINARQIDGSRPTASLSPDIIIWIMIAAGIFVLNRKARDKFNKLVLFLPLLIGAMGITSLVTQTYTIVSQDDSGVLYDTLMNETNPFVLSGTEKFTLSDEHNLLVILTDEYDSFSFDNTLTDFPETSDIFRDFTYYKDTLGMYGYSAAGINHIFTQIRAEDPVYRTDFFDRLRDSGYRIELYTSTEVFPDNIYSEYAANYLPYEITARDIFNLDSCLLRLAAYKYSFSLIKPLFYISNFRITELISAGQPYYPDNLTLYNSVPDTFRTDSSGKLFEFIYLWGLHDPRNITADLQRAPDWSVAPDDEAVAINKILGRFLDSMRDSGVYDCSDIIILADHGVKSHTDGKYPLLMIKPAYARSDKLTISETRVSYEDVFPTLMYLAGDESSRSVFDLTPEDNEERYFAGTDEYIYGSIDKSDTRYWHGNPGAAE